MTDVQLIMQQFQRITFEALSAPYQYICGHYYDYIERLSRYKGTDEAVSELKKGIEGCPCWDVDETNEHFGRVLGVLQKVCK